MALGLLFHSSKNQLDQPKREVLMDAKFDIFKRLPDGDPIWVQAIDGIEQAKEQLARLASSTPGEYFIYNVQGGCVVQSSMASGG
jgi:hypothetical protein